MKAYSQVRQDLPVVRGFSLLELLVVLAISAMLMLLATDGYAAVRARAARHEVRMALWRLAAAQETHRLQHGFYASRLAVMPLAATSATELAPPTLPPAGWSFSLVALTEENWELQAVAMNPVTDPACAELRLDMTGMGFARAMDGRDTSRDCWRR
jgi:prepilin-type N-terminal cleavage/methylation domain-containing protein